MGRDHHLDDQSIHSLRLLVHLLRVCGGTVPNWDQKFGIRVDQRSRTNRQHSLSICHWDLIGNRHEQLVPYSFIRSGSLVLRLLPARDPRHASAGSHLRENGYAKEGKERTGDLVTRRRWLSFLTRHQPTKSPWRRLHRDQSPEILTRPEGEKRHYSMT